MEGFGMISALGAGIDLINADINRKEQRNTNEENRRFDLSMHRLKRSEDLADWQTEADYNSPKQQMQRLKEAGLNPHLVYGKGADATMGSVKSGSIPHSQAQAPKLDYNFQKSISDVMGAQATKLQVDNLKTQNEILQAEAAGKQLDNQQKAFDLGFNQDVRGYRVENERLRIEGTRQSIDAKEVEMWLQREQNQYNRDSNSRANEKQPYEVNALQLENRLKRVTTENGILQGKNLYQQWLHEQVKMAKTQGEIAMLQQATKNAQVDGKLKEAEYTLAKLGINKSDPDYLRLMTMSLALDPNAMEKVMMTAGIAGIAGKFLPRIPNVKMAQPTTPKSPLTRRNPSTKFKMRTYEGIRQR